MALMSPRSHEPKDRTNQAPCVPRPSSHSSSFLFFFILSIPSYPIPSFPFSVLSYFQFFLFSISSYFPCVLFHLILFLLFLFLYLRIYLLFLLILSSYSFSGSMSPHFLPIDLKIFFAPSCIRSKHIARNANPMKRYSAQHTTFPCAPGFVTSIPGT